MKYAICTVSAAAIRKEPAHRTEMTSQLLFGETVEVLEEKDEWTRIRSLYDNYEGWLTYHLIRPTEEAIATAPLRFVTTSLLNPITSANNIVLAPLGSSLTFFNGDTKKLWDEQYEFHGTFRNVAEGFNFELFKELLPSWIGSPYLWGGRTFMGVDCSGFVQTVFKVLGIPLRRDAYQQAEQGTVIENLADAQITDLAFFNSDEGKIIHVGILLDEGRIIHSSGKVRIDTMDEEGIINSDTGKRTHKLHSVRRII